MADNRLIIFDTTLRDGEQSPGASMNLAEKLEVARALARPRRGRDRGRLPHRLARRFRGGAGHRPHRSTGRSSAAWPAATPTTSTAPGKRSAMRPGRASTSSWPPAPFTANSSCNMAKEEIVRRAVEGVKRAKEYCDDVEFSPEDAARTELDFLAEVVERAIEAGATTVNIPDTVGYAVPSQYAAAIRHLKQHVRNIDQGRYQRPLPQRSGSGGGQQPGRPARRGPAGRVYDQRHRRAGRQLCPGRDRHGRPHPRRLLRPDARSINTKRLYPTSR